MEDLESQFWRAENVGRSWRRRRSKPRRGAMGKKMERLWI
jgi:hypothetical protein